jgi:hypothetical protein
MSEDAETLLLRHEGGQVLVDTNILLLYFVGSFKRELVGQFKRVAQFRRQDFDVLLRLFAWIPDVVTTPHVLAEVNSLSGQLGEPDRSAYFEHFAAVIPLLDERHVPSAATAADPRFVKLGLTDTSLFAHGAGLLILTDDFRLSGHLTAAGLDSINFNHLRDFDF